MAILSCEGQIEGSLPPAKMFKLLVLDVETNVSKVVPDAVKSFENVDGDGGPGSLRKITFGDGSPISHVIDTIDAVDKENLTFQYTMIGGDPSLLDKKVCEKMTFHLKFESSPNGGTIGKRSCHAYTIDGVEINEEDIIARLETSNQVFYQMFRIFEAYGLANPESC